MLEHNESTTHIEDPTPSLTSTFTSDTHNLPALNHTDHRYSTPINLNNFIISDRDFNASINIDPDHIDEYDEYDDDMTLDFEIYVSDSEDGNIDYFVSNILNKLDLEKYTHSFKQFNITKKNLIHLDKSVVQCMISDNKDQNNFIKWLQRYQQFRCNVTTVQFNLEILKLLENRIKYPVFGFVRLYEMNISFYIPNLIRWLILHYYICIGVDNDENEQCLYWIDLKKKTYNKHTTNEKQTLSTKANVYDEIDISSLTIDFEPNTLLWQKR
eukprot:364714_1